MIAIDEAEAPWNLRIKGQMWSRYDTKPKQNKHWTWFDSAKMQIFICFRLLSGYLTAAKCSLGSTKNDIDKVRIGIERVSTHLKRTNKSTIYGKLKILVSIYSNEI